MNCRASAAGSEKQYLEHVEGKEVEGLLGRRAQHIDQVAPVQAGHSAARHDAARGRHQIGRFALPGQRHHAGL